MSDELPKRLQISWRRLGRVGKNKLILLTLILIFSMGLFFYSFSQASTDINTTLASKEISPDVIDPLNKIGKGIINDNKLEKKITLVEKSENKKTKKELKNKDNPLEKAILSLVSGHPIEMMALAISQQEKTVASFLVAIAMKESSWGEHAPSKNGKDCYNYWGYKGGINPTEGGYSCFETPEQAVEVVGGRLKNLVDKGINTPEKLLVWKCGSSCASHNQKDVRKWVTDVTMYNEKMNKIN